MQDWKGRVALWPHFESPIPSVSHRPFWGLPPGSPVIVQDGEQVPTSDNGIQIGSALHHLPLAICGVCSLIFPE
jgi:hypothetical protein